MKYLLLTLSILLLSSCTHKNYNYIIELKRCEGQIIWVSNPYYSGSTILIEGNNICDFSYTRTEIK